MATSFALSDRITLPVVPHFLLTTSCLKRLVLENRDLSVHDHQWLVG